MVYSNSLFRGFNALNPLKSELLTKQACRDELGVYSLFFSPTTSTSLYLYVLSTFFTNIELYTLYMVYIYMVYIYIYMAYSNSLFRGFNALNPLKSELLTKQACRDELGVYSLFFL